LAVAYETTLEGWARTLELRDRETQGHSQRVLDLTLRLARKLGFTDEELVHVQRGALLHDIGKVDISTTLIDKAASLSHEEKYLMDSHTERGAQILSSVASVLGDAIPLVRAHHQYFDQDKQKESPLGEMPLGARILAVADAYDAMTTDRPYRSGMPPWKAFEELEQCTGTQFDPEVVECFKTVLFQHSGTHLILSGNKASTSAS